ncbi:MAG TPA: GntR family transcriptional regulator [Xanthobacteraceae bacterium]|nr:GntR family transcriptional regulator [Xanthobacteraceae bacterium]
MPVNPTVARRTLHDELLPLLRDMILDGELGPGSRIPEQALCARFGVSRTPLREALKMLSVKGLVHLLPHKGASVVRITQKEAEELIPLLGILEAHASELACAKIDEAGLRRITEMHGQLLENHRHGDEPGYLRTNRAIHAAIVAAAGNHMLSQVHHLVEMRLCLLPVPRKLSPQWDEAIGDHEDILEALRTRDGVRLAGIMRDHVRHKMIVIGRAFEARRALGAVAMRVIQ